MSSPVQTTTPETNAPEAARKCAEHDINSLAVVSDGDLVGIVTGTDLLDVLGSVSEPRTIPVSEIMSAPVVTTTPDATVTEAMVVMSEQDVARLVVVDDEELVGLVSTDDVIRYVPQVFHRQELDTRPEDGHSDRTHGGTAYENADWDVSSTGMADDQVDVGDRVTFTKTISEQDVRTFAAASGDTNRLHLESAYAERTRFGRRIAHGTLVSGLVSAALARLPGLTIYLSQDLSFLGPVDIGQRVTAVCEVVGTIGPRKYELTTDVVDPDEQTVVEGQATVLVDDLPDV